MSVSKERWDQIKADLSHPYGMANFRCDGYLLAAVVRTSKMKLIIEVWVNGKYEGKNFWTGKESLTKEMPEIPRRFYFWKKTHRPAKEVKLYEKLWGKRECTKRGVYDAHIYTVPYFNTPGAFISHIKKHNQEIEELDYTDYKAAIDELKANDEVADAAQ